MLIVFNKKKMKKNTILFLVATTLLFSSCAQLFNATVLPRQCKKCELFNTATGEKLWEIEGCGSENTGLNEKCLKKAWELSRGQRLCDFNYKCKTWRKPKDQ